jgi:hypothetical protein
MFPSSCYFPSVRYIYPLDRVSDASEHWHFGQIINNKKNPVRRIKLEKIFQTLALKFFVKTLDNSFVRHMHAESLIPFFKAFALDLSRQNLRSMWGIAQMQRDQSAGLYMYTDTVMARMCAKHITFMVTNKKRKYQVARIKTRGRDEWSTYV